MVPLNIPNALTMLRILAVPVVVVALLAEIPNGDLIAGIVFALAALTDGLDGYIARRRDDVTTFGKLMDPLADKLLIVAALVSLVALDRLQAWIAMVIIARELAVTGLRALAVEQGVVISASWLGKVKTALQIAAVIALIAVDPATTAVDILVYAAVAVTVISGADYFFGVRRRIEKQRQTDGDPEGERRLGRPRDLLRHEPAEQAVRPEPPRLRDHEQEPAEHLGIRAEAAADDLDGLVGGLDRRPARRPCEAVRAGCRRPGELAADDDTLGSEQVDQAGHGNADVAARVGDHAVCTAVAFECAIHEPLDRGDVGLALLEGAEHRLASRLQPRGTRGCRSGRPARPRDDGHVPDLAGRPGTPLKRRPLWISPAPIPVATLM